MNLKGSKLLTSGLFSKKTDTETILDSVSQGIVILDTDLNVVFFNTAAQSVTGGLYNTSKGIPCRYFLRCSLCTNGCPLKAKEELNGKQIETDILNSNRQKIPVKITFSKIKDENSNLQGYILLISDIKNLEKQSRQEKENYTFSSIIGKSSEMEKVYRLLPVLAQSDASILITGETGTGKDLLAEELHKASDRADGPFIKVNCGALPETLLESELFGHTKGA
ncbi:MAG: sigma 54-interacting transcriptional regulator, partial [Candidatus Muiribacteriota bacterium]